MKLLLLPLCLGILAVVGAKYSKTIKNLNKRDLAGGIDVAALKKGDGLGGESSLDSSELESIESVLESGEEKRELEEADKKIFDLLEVVFVNAERRCNKSNVTDGDRETRGNCLVWAVLLQAENGKETDILISFLAGLVAGAQTPCGQKREIFKGEKAIKRESMENRFKKIGAASERASSACVREVRNDTTPKEVLTCIYERTIKNLKNRDEKDMARALFFGYFAAYSKKCNIDTN